MANAFERAPWIRAVTIGSALPGGGGDRTTGERRFVPALVRAACAVGCDALFIETHPDPMSAPSDGPNMVPLAEMRVLLESALRIRDNAA